jgi:hypothetical protein
MKWDLDLWYELWDRAGSQGLDTWYDPRTEEQKGTDSELTPDVGGSDTAAEEKPLEGA